MRLPLWGEERRQATIAAADWRLCVTLRCQEEIYRDKEQEVWGEDIYFKRQKKEEKTQRNIYRKNKLDQNF